MNTNEDSKELLANSYQHSANRIIEALQGKLTIQNSREPQNPPSFPGDVVGLCGQGGRHPYFRIPISVLNVALDRISRAAMDPSGRASSIDIRMEEIAEACQDLRQQTYFDAKTSCVNDSLPSMVPLLPPEEIWLEGRELPLDIWRLISFEFDLVSSSVSSQVSVEDFAFSAVSQSALAFRFLINQLGNRRVTFEVKLSSLPVAWGSSGSMTMQASLARIFFEAGSLLTPLATEEFIKWYGAVRYLHWIDKGATELRVRDEFNADSVDCRYRGLFAEETAIGLMAIVLSDVFGAKPINNTVEVIPTGLIEPGQPIADFVALAIDPISSNGTTIIAESKGSLGSLVSKARYLRAKQQLAATNILFAGSTDTLPLTFGSAVRFSKQKSKSHCIVVDPPSDFGPDPIRIDPVDAWRVAYAKALKFVGLEGASQQVLRGDPAALRPMDFDRQLDRRRSDRDHQRLRRANSARHRFDMDLLLDVGPAAVSVDTNVLTELRHGINAQSQLRLSEVLRARREFSHLRSHSRSFETSLGLGCISYADLDENSDGNSNS